MESGKPQRSVSRKDSFPGSNPGDAPLKNPNRFSKPVLSYPERVQEVFEQDLSRMNRRGRHSMRPRRQILQSAVETLAAYRGEEILGVVWIF